MTDGDLSLVYQLPIKQVLAAYNREHAEKQVDVELDLRGCMEDELPEVYDWLEQKMARFQTVDGKGKRLRWAFEARSQKVFYFHVKEDAMLLGFYLFSFRCSDGNSFRPMAYSELALSAEEQRRLNEAVAELGLEAPSLTIMVHS